MTKRNGKIGRGDLVLMNVNIGGHRHLIIDMSTCGRMHGEFLRLLFIIAHRRTVRWFKDVGDDHHSADAFKFRRGQYFWHTRAAIGHGATRSAGA